MAKAISAPASAPITTITVPHSDPYTAPATMAIGALGIGLRTMAVIIRPMIPTGPQYPSWSIHSDKAALLVTAVNAPVSSMTQ